MARVPRDTDIWPDNPKEIAAWLLFISVILLMAVIWYTNPYVLHTFDRAGGEVFIASDGDQITTAAEPLYIAVGDIAYLNRIFRERSHEVGYCGLLDGRQLRPYLADTINASRVFLEFSTANCPVTPPPGTIHTHPSGSLGLSLGDQTNFARKNYRFMCVQGGILATEAGTRVENLACYKPIPTPSGLGYARIPVVVNEPAG